MIAIPEQAARLLSQGEFRSRGMRPLIHALNRYVIAPALEGSDKVSEPGCQEILDDLSRTIPPP